MSDFQTQPTSTTSPALDPYKHVKYSLGMVLGADDFDQEFAYLAERDQWLARDTIGYGTVCGLKVSIETDAHGPRVLVTPGAALSPRGQLLRVTPAQCAYLNDWLDAHHEEVVRQLGSPVGDQLTLYVVLCYRACPTDNVPIPGEPCRDESQSTVASRLEDDFRLELSFTPPDQTEEDAVRDFVAWLSQIPVTDAPTSFATINDFLEALRQAAPLIEAAPSSPLDYMYGSPLDTMHINTEDACKYWRAAFRLWVTELRPRWRGYLRYSVKDGDHLATIAARFNVSEDALAQLNHISDDLLQVGMVLKIPKLFCEGTPPDEECVLLAELSVPLVAGRAGSMNNDNVHEERRPYVVHLRLLQEWLICGPRPTAANAIDLNGDVMGPVASNWLTRIQGKAIEAPAPSDGQVLTFIQAENKWKPAEPGLSGDVIGPIGNNTVERIQHVDVDPTGPTSGQVLTFNGAQWAPAPLPPTSIPTLANDVIGPIGNNTVARIQHVDVDSTVPTDGQVLTYDDNTKQWVPRAPTGGPAPGDFVEHPAGLPRYFIVAAGIARCDGSNPTPNWAPNYNGLFIEVVEPNRVRVHFDTYTLPTGGHQYIIKAIPVYNKDDWEKLQIKQPFVNFEKYDDQGIILFVAGLSQQIDNIQTLTDLAFVIEVSEYQK